MHSVSRVTADTIGTFALIHRYEQHGAKRTQPAFPDRYPTRPGEGDLQSLSIASGLAPAKVESARYFEDDYQRL